MPGQAIELRMGHAMSADLTTLVGEINKLLTVQHRHLVCLQRSQPAASTANKPCCHIQRRLHLTFLKLRPSVRRKVSEAVIDGNYCRPLRQRQLSANTLQHLSNG